MTRVDLKKAVLVELKPPWQVGKRKEKEEKGRSRKSKGLQMFLESFLLNDFYVKHPNELIKEILFKDRQPLN